MCVYIMSLYYTDIHLQIPSAKRLCLDCFSCRKPVKSSRRVRRFGENGASENLPTDHELLEG